MHTRIVNSSTILVFVTMSHYSHIRMTSNRIQIGIQSSPPFSNQVLTFPRLNSCLGVTSTVISISLSSVPSPSYASFTTTLKCSVLVKQKSLGSIKVFTCPNEIALLLLLSRLGKDHCSTHKNLKLLRDYLSRFYRISSSTGERRFELDSVGNYRRSVQL